MSKVMAAGYCRLSKDEEKKKYASIDAQKEEIIKYAESQGWGIYKIYIDDGYTGYKFNRPDLNEMLDDLTDNKFQIIIAKDLSRIGRHNAKTLLLLEEIQENGKRIITLSDNTDTENSDSVEGDFTGIKTLMNELYIKDLSRKIRFNLKNYQENNTYLNSVPYGYKKDEVTNKIVIDENTAPVVKKIFDLYLNGNGYLKIARILTTDEKIDAPSEYARKQAENEGKIFKQNTQNKWYDSIIQYILKNDVYTGTLRHRKTIRDGIHGKQRWTKDNEQIIFENNHEPIISKEDFKLAQELMEKRKSLNYRGYSKYDNPYSEFLFCKECGKKLVSRNQVGRPKAYMCSTYKYFGKDQCDIHYVREDNLNYYMIEHVKLIKQAVKDFEIEINRKLTKNMQTQKNYNAIIRKTEQDIINRKNELKVLLNQKIKAIAKNPEMEKELEEQYDSLEKDKLNDIKMLEKEIVTFKQLKDQTEDVSKEIHSAQEVCQKIIDRGYVVKKDLYILLDKIYIDKNGIITVKQKESLVLLLSKHRETVGEQVNIIKVKAIKYLADCQDNMEIKYEGVS